MWIGEHAPGSDAASEMLALALVVEERLGLPPAKAEARDEADLTKAAASA